MAAPEKSFMGVFRLPELFDAVVQYLDPKAVHTLRLVNGFFRSQCSAHFSITLDLEKKLRYPDLRSMADSALAVEGMETAEQDRTSYERWNPLDQIQSLKASAGLSSGNVLTPELASILNRCRNLRHIHINDSSYSAREFPDRLSYPSRFLWSSMDPVAGGAGGDSVDRESWSFWDLTPLEGSLCRRLESLTIVVGRHPALNLDRFMTRLSYSCVAKSLRTLKIVCSAYIPMEISWKVFRDCICSFSVLETLDLDDVKIIHSKDPVDDPDHDSQLRETQSWVTPTVKSLRYRFGYHQDQDFKLAFMSLFPNLESLDLASMVLLDGAINERVCSEADRQLPMLSCSDRAAERNASLPVPFPRLKSLNCTSSNIYARHWRDGQILRLWAQRTPNFRINSLFFERADKDIYEELSRSSASLAKIDIEENRHDLVKELLSSPLCRNLQELKFRSKSLDCASLFLACLENPIDLTTLFLDQECSAPRPLPSQVSSWDAPLSQQDFFTRLTWTRTLSTLCLRNLVDFDRVSKDKGHQSLAFMRTFLKFLPRLADFEVVDPISDLSVFHGLGRQPTSVGDSTDTETNSSNLTEGSLLWKNYCLLERPLLTRLKLCKTWYSSSTRDEWRHQLRSQFRFLKNFTLDEERHYNDNGGYDPSNFCTSDRISGGY